MGAAVGAGGAGVMAGGFKALAKLGSLGLDAASKIMPGLTPEQRALVIELRKNPSARRKILKAATPEGEYEAVSKASKEAADILAGMKQAAQSDYGEGVRKIVKESQEGMEDELAKRAMAGDWEVARSIVSNETRDGKHFDNLLTIQNESKKALQPAMKQITDAGKGRFYAPKTKQILNETNDIIDGKYPWRDEKLRKEGIYKVDEDLGEGVVITRYQDKAGNDIYDVEEAVGLYDLLEARKQLGKNIKWTGKQEKARNLDQGVLQEARDRLDEQIKKISGVKQLDEMYADYTDTLKPLIKNIQSAGGEIDINKLKAFLTSGSKANVNAQASQKVNAFLDKYPELANRELIGANKQATGKTIKQAIEQFNRTGSSLGKAAILKEIQNDKFGSALSKVLGLGGLGASAFTGWALPALVVTNPIEYIRAKNWMYNTLVGKFKINPTKAEAAAELLIARRGAKEVQENRNKNKGRDEVITMVD